MTGDMSQGSGQWSGDGKGIWERGLMGCRGPTHWGGRAEALVWCGGGSEGRGAWAGNAWEAMESGMCGSGRAGP